MTRLVTILTGILLALTVAGTSAADAGGTSRPLIIESPPRVMVLPFVPTGDANSYAWVGEGIQQSLLTEVSRPGMTAFTIPATQSSTVTGDPVAAAASAGATVVVYGNFQINSGDIRMTGQVMDVATHKTIGALIATGSLHDLFKLEDALGDQLRRSLPGAGNHRRPKLRCAAGDKSRRLLFHPRFNVRLLLFGPDDAHLLLSAAIRAGLFLRLLPQLLSHLCFL